ncbi:MAG: 3'-5' exonuclease, partial [Candidatus Kapaibacteriota bacterium]
MAFIVCNESFKNKFGSISFNSLLDRIVDFDNLRNYYFVCATNQLANNFKLNLASKYYNRTGKPIVNTTVSNLESLIRRIFSILKSNGSSLLLSDAYRFLIFKEAFDKSHLNFFKQKDEKVSLHVIKWLSQIIFGLKEDGITYENFDEEISKDSNTIVNLAKYLDTKILFESYQKLLEENNFYDIIDATYFTANLLRDYLSKQGNSDEHLSLPIIERGVSFIFIGFFDFKLPEIDFIGALGKYENPLAIFLDFDETNGPLFGNFNDLIVNFKKQGLLALSVPESSEETNTNFLKKYLFNNLFGRIKDGLAERIRICAVQNRYVEAKQIAKLCKYLIQIKGYKPSEICITTKNPQSYAALFREVFQEVGVPLNVTERFRLSSSPLVLSILSALNVVARGFRFSDLRKVLLSFYFKFGKKNELGEVIEIDVENFLDVTTKMKVIGGEEFGGKTYWLRRFENRLKAINNRMTLLHYDGYSDQMEISNLEKEKMQVEKAKEDFLVLLYYFDFEDKNLTINRF